MSNRDEIKERLETFYEEMIDDTDLPASRRRAVWSPVLDELIEHGRKVIETPVKVQPKRKEPQYIQ